MIEALIEDYRSAPISDPEKAMLDYVVKLSLEPWAMVESDVGHLREHGFSDGAILDICQVAAYYAFANRLADGLGIELEAVHLEAENAPAAEEG